MELHELTAVEAAEQIRSGGLSALDYARSLLSRAESLEPRLSALAHFDPPAFLAAAARSEAATVAARSAKKPAPPLSGIPLGVKDNIDTAGVPTRAGSRLHAGRVPRKDAAALEALYEAGAYLHSKTATTELAYFDPASTRNPWNPAHTPGGSSSGSAAGVAAGYFPLALGTQTAGSVIRPAAFCGVVGFVPTQGRISLSGVIPFAPTVDALGIFARSVSDAAFAYAALTASKSGAGDSPAPAGSAFPIQPLDRPPFLGLGREYFVETAEDEEGRMTIHVARTLASSGAIVHVVHLPASFEQVHGHHRRLMEVEMARQHREGFRSTPQHYGKKLSELIAAGLSARDEDYRRALGHRERFRADASRLLAELDALLLPSVPFAAPYGLESTGDPRFNIPWTNAGFPVIALPVGLSIAGLPLGIQLVGSPGADHHLLRVARYVEERLDWGRRMPP